MYCTQIMLKGFVEAEAFTKAIKDLDMDMDLSIGRYTVDARSILGIMSLDLNKTITLKCITDSADDIERIKERISRFEVSGGS